MGDLPLRWDRSEAISGRHADHARSNSAVLAKRNAIAAALRAIVPGEGVIAQPIEMRAFRPTA